jgi:hypothetical protein
VTFESSGQPNFAILSVPPSFDRAGTRLVLRGRNQSLGGAPVCNVYDANMQLIGTLPDTTLAVIVHPDGSRAYVLDNAGNLRSFDLTANVMGGAYPEVGTGVAIGTFGETDAGGVRMAITPDGGTLFIAGRGGILVQPSPP